jgi:UDP-glucose 4-epimerase
MSIAFLTGATGFIGSNLLKRLRADRWETIATSRRGGLVNGISVAPLDMTDEQEIMSFCSNIKCDVVFHLAAIVPNSFKHEEAMESFIPNIKGTLSFLNAAIIMQAKTFVFSSSSSVYGLKCNRITEETKFEPFNFYSISKFVGDILCEQYRLTGKIKTFTLRISAPYGPNNQKPTVINKFIENALKNKPLKIFGSGLRKQDFTYIDDVAESLLLAYENRTKEGGIINIASGRSVTMKELAEIVISCVPGTKSKIKYVGADPQENYRPEYDITKAKQMLNFSPKVTLEEGIKRCVYAKQRGFKGFK